MDRRAGRVVARSRRAAVRAPPGGGLRRRAPAVHHVHQRYHGQPERHPAHQRRLPDASGDDAPPDLRYQAREGHLLDRSRHRLGDGPQLHRVRAPGQRHHVGHLRGHPGHPARDRWWSIVERYQVDDPLHGADDDPHLHEVGRGSPAGHDLSSLRLLGSVGEPINPEAWMWYRQHVGGDRCPSSTPGGRPRPAVS